MARACITDCQVVGPKPGLFAKKGGQWTAIVLDASTWKYNGNSCDAVADKPAGEPPVRCPTGQCPGTVNGTLACYACEATATQKETVTVTPPSGGASAPTSVTEREITTCENGVCKTERETIRPGDGPGSGGSDPVVDKGPTTEKDERSFCQENPTSPVCKEAEKSRFGGACQGGFTCSGDAIQCAIAREVFTRNCAFFQPGGALAAEGEALLANGGDRSAEHPWLNPVTKSFAGGFGADSNLIGAGTCPADISVPVPGRASMVISFAPLCSSAVWLGNLLIGITALSCVGIVFIGGKRGV